MSPNVTDRPTDVRPSRKLPRFKGDVGVVSIAMGGAEVPQKPMLSHRNGVIAMAESWTPSATMLRAPFPWFGGKSRTPHTTAARPGPSSTKTARSMSSTVRRSHRKPVTNP